MSGVSGATLPHLTFSEILKNSAAGPGCLGKKNRTQAQTTGSNSTPKMRPDKGTGQGNIAQAATGEAIARAWVKPASNQGDGVVGEGQGQAGRRTQLPTPDMLPLC